MREYENRRAWCCAPTQRTLSPPPRQDRWKAPPSCEPVSTAESTRVTAHDVRSQCVVVDSGVPAPAGVSIYLLVSMQNLRSVPSLSM